MNIYIIITEYNIAIPTLLVKPGTVPKTSYMTNAIKFFYSDFRCSERIRSYSTWKKCLSYIQYNSDG